MPLTTVAGPADVPSPEPVRRVVLLVGKLLDVKTGATSQDAAIAIEGTRRRRRPAQPRRRRRGPRSSSSRMPSLPGYRRAHAPHGDPKTAATRGSACRSRGKRSYGAKNAKITLEAGFTTVRNVGANGFSDVALRTRSKRATSPGRAWRERARARITGGHCDNNLVPFDIPSRSKRESPTASRPCSTTFASHQVRRDLIKSARPAAFCPKATIRRRRSTP